MLLPNGQYEGPKKIADSIPPSTMKEVFQAPKGLFLSYHGF